jgi:hypothetical protein
MEAINTRYITIELNYSSESGSAPINKFIECNSGVLVGIDYLSCDIEINRAYGFISDTATVTIKGLTVDVIESLTYANLNYEFDINKTNIITIYAGYTFDEKTGLPPCIYRGFIVQALPDFNSSRDRAFVIQSIQEFASQNIIQNAFNIKGQYTLDQLFNTIVTAKIGANYQSVNVVGSVFNTIYFGSGIDQLRQACRDYGYKYHYIYSTGSELDTIVVTPLGIPNEKEDNILINKDNGMIGFPTINFTGVNVQTYFNNKYQLGSPVTLQSLTVPFVNDLKLYINEMTYNLSNKKPEFFVTMQLNTIKAFA